MSSRKLTRVTKDKAMSLDISTMLTVAIGQAPNHKHFLAHQGIICARSAYFRRAMTLNTTERQQRLFKFPDHDPEVFAIYFNFVYTNTIATIQSDARKDDFAFGEEYTLLSKLYVLAGKLGDIAAKNATVEAILAVNNERDSKGFAYLPSAGAIKILYSGTPKTSRARLLYADMWTSCNEDKLAAARENLPPDFVWDLALALRGERMDDGVSLARKAVKEDGVGRYLEEVQ
ncbi:hypothetical protein FB567DRAFT_15492 [Paraphoma chrysanthemicola]|uniref:BTB domain-containing protein n=1 Tax=Paraphoma chrysanthemicola TaxID=798071 RepID=A0A8K0W3R5_9PLEO|nr:hypothetical protein FB567DRAFT_15492 [Paraphoma chrysanthemicola]